MSHSRERKEKICLNCRAELYGKYCHVCGQENREPHETFWGLVTHFVHDITHFDGKFFKGVKGLFAAPGLLPREYINGRRASYLNPIRMYIFTSAVFFVVFFSTIGKPPDTVIDFGPETDTVGRSITAEAFGKQYKSVKDYDSLQASLPLEKRDGTVKKWVTRRLISLGLKFAQDPNTAVKTWVDRFIHLFPQMFFVSLPLFALALYLLYFRRRKQFYYTDHGIFAIYQYIFTFLVMLVMIMMNFLEEVTGSNIFIWINVLLLLYVLTYLYLAMRRFYGQSRWKTRIKFFLLSIAGFLVIAMVFIVFLLYSVFRF